MLNDNPTEVCKALHVPFFPFRARLLAPCRGHCCPRHRSPCAPCVMTHWRRHCRALNECTRRSIDTAATRDPGPPPVASACLCTCAGAGPARPERASGHTVPESVCISVHGFVQRCEKEGEAEKERRSERIAENKSETGETKPRPDGQTRDTKRPERDTSESSVRPEAVLEAVPREERLLVLRPEPALAVPRLVLRLLDRALGEVRQVHEQDAAEEDAAPR